MMKLLKKIDLKSYRLHTLAKIIRNNNYTYSYSRLKQHSPFVNFRNAENNWSVWFHFSELASLLIPSISGMFITNKMKEKVSEIIMHNAAEIIEETGIKLVAEARSWDVTVTDKAVDELLLGVKTSKLNLYVEDCPSLNKNIIFSADRYLDLMCPVDAIISTFYLPLSGLKQLAEGDVILLYKSCLKLCVFHKEIAIENWNKEVDMLDDYLNQPSKEEEPNCLTTHDFNDLPVKVDVVLFSTTMTLRELNKVVDMKVYTLPVDAQKRCFLKVNDMIIAKCELVELDEKLAVEIIEFSGGWGDE